MKQIKRESNKISRPIVDIILGVEEKENQKKKKKKKQEKVKIFSQFWKDKKNFDFQDKQELFSDKFVPNKNIVLQPEYEEVKYNNEVFKVIKEFDTQKYQKLGFKHDDPMQSSEHLRLYLETSIEKSDYFGEKRNSSLSITKGKNLMDYKKGVMLQRQPNKSVGHCKVNIHLIKQDLLNELIKLSSDINEKILLGVIDFELREGQKLFLEQVTLVVYMIKAEFYENQNYYSQNNSFYEMEIESNKARSEVIKENNNPFYYTSHQFEIMMPMNALLTISFYD